MMRERETFQGTYRATAIPSWRGTHAVLRTSPERKIGSTILCGAAGSYTVSDEAFDSTGCGKCTRLLRRLNGKSAVHRPVLPIPTGSPAVRAAGIGAASQYERRRAIYAPTAQNRPSASRKGRKRPKRRPWKRFNSRIDQEATLKMDFQDSRSHITLDGRHLYHGRDAQAAYTQAHLLWNGNCAKCELPVERGTAEWHHIISKGAKGYRRDDHPRNRAFLCQDCHKAEHHREVMWSGHAKS